MKERYKINNESKVGDECVCPSCGSRFIKEHYQQKFCKTKGGTICKDKYWNTITPNKRDNRTRISPANAAFRARYIERDDRGFNPDDYEHPHSSEALGQWND